MVQTPYHGLTSVALGRCPWREFRPTDITIISNIRGSDLDPSAPEDGYMAKWGVDATAKPSLATYTPRNRVPKDVFGRLDLKDFVPSSWLTQKGGKR